MGIDFLWFDEVSLLGESVTAAIAHFSGPPSVKRGIQATCRLPVQRHSLARECSRPIGQRALLLLAECSPRRRRA
jgi:hypothetical protein